MEPGPGNERLIVIRPVPPPVTVKWKDCVLLADMDVGLALAGVTTAPGVLDTTATFGSYATPLLFVMDTTIGNEPATAPVIV